MDVQEKFDAASVHDEGYLAHVNCEGKESNPYPRNSAAWQTWNAGYDVSEEEYENGED